MGLLLGLFFPGVTVVCEGALGVLNSLCKIKFPFQFFHGFCFEGFVSFALA